MTESQGIKLLHYERQPKLMRLCPTCHGDGFRLLGAHTIPCEQCGMRGHVIDMSFNGIQPIFETRKGMVVS